MFLHLGEKRDSLAALRFYDKQKTKKANVILSRRPGKGSFSFVLDTATEDRNVCIVKPDEY